MKKPRAGASQQARYRTGGAGSRRRVREGPVEGTVSTTMRLRGAVRTALEAWARRERRSVADVAQELLEEGLRMRACPGIYFATEATGRTAKVAGTGLGVWEVLRDFVADRDVAGVQAAFPHLSASQIRAALLYEKAYPDEVRAAVEANAALTPEALERLHPGLVRVVPAG